MKERTEAYLNQKRHFQCRKFPCIYYRTMTILAECPDLYLALCQDGQPACYPVTLEDIRGKRLLFSLNQHNGKLEDGLAAQVCVRDGSWVAHINGIISGFSPETGEFQLTELSGCLHHIGSGVEQTLVLD